MRATFVGLVLVISPRCLHNNFTPAPLRKPLW